MILRIALAPQSCAARYLTPFFGTRRSGLWAMTRDRSLSCCLRWCSAAWRLYGHSFCAIRTAETRTRLGFRALLFLLRGNLVGNFDLAPMGRFCSERYFGEQRPRLSLDARRSPQKPPLVPV